MSGRRRLVRTVVSGVCLVIGLLDANAILLVLGGVGMVAELVLVVHAWTRSRRGESGTDARFEAKTRIAGSLFIGVVLAAVGVLTLFFGGGGKVVAGVVVLIGGLLFAGLGAAVIVHERRRRS